MRMTDKTIMQWTTKQSTIAKGDKVWIKQALCMSEFVFVVVACIKLSD